MLGYLYVRYSQEYVDGGGMKDWAAIRKYELIGAD